MDYQKKRSLLENISQEMGYYSMPMFAMNNPIVGGILMVRSDTILSKGIRFFMNLLKKKKGYRSKAEFSHADIVLYVSGIGLVVVGAVKGGVRMRRFDYSYPESSWDNIAIFVPKEPFKHEEKQMLFNLMIAYTMEGHIQYQYRNFIQWVRYITIGWWVGKSSADKMYCLEVAKRAYAHIDDMLVSDNLEVAHTFDFTDNPNLSRMPRETFEYYYNLINEDIQKAKSVKKSHKT